MKIKRIAKLAQELTSEDYATLIELRKVFAGAGAVTARPKRKYTRKAKAAEIAPKPKRVRKAAMIVPGNGGAEPVKRGPGRPRKVRTIPVVGAETEHVEA
jgi:hypothetical protein